MTSAPSYPIASLYVGDLHPEVSEAMLFDWNWTTDWNDYKAAVLIRNSDCNLLKEYRTMESFYGKWMNLNVGERKQLKVWPSLSTPPPSTQVGRGTRCVPGPT